MADKLVKKFHPHVLILDLRMPGMSGADFLREVRNRWPETLRIMLTGFADTASIMDVVEEIGVFKFITKPWNDDDLRLTVRLAFKQYRLQQENRRLRELNKQQRLEFKNVSAPLRQNQEALANLLMKAELIGEEQLREAQREQKIEESLLDCLLRLELVTEESLCRACEEQLHIANAQLEKNPPDADMVRFLPADICRHGRLVPVQLSGRQLSLAMADPTDLLLREHIELLTGLQVVPLMATVSAIDACLLQVFDAESISSAAQSGSDTVAQQLEMVNDADDSLEQLLDQEDVSVVNLINSLIVEAVRQRASDIHIEPKENHSVVRCRIDGMLRDRISFPAQLHSSLVSRIKIIARLDIAERRKPQDGRFSCRISGRNVDVRVAILPTISGEKVVLRILDKGASIHKLAELGVLEKDLQRIERMLHQPQGILIATGPTGSGKTTLLYSMLNEMIQQNRNFQTIEDPVEYFLEGANQTYVRGEIGLSFASVLRATLRQDPDVILVGEIRDLETADVAFKAALTGHMVLTTLHTNNSIATLTRLIDMGVKPYLLASAIEGIIAQRLVRRICPHCREQVAVDTTQLQLLGVLPQFFVDPVWQGRGCSKCEQTGYLGRAGIFEVLLLTNDLCRLINLPADENDLLSLARAEGMTTLLEDGLEKVRCGMTTVAEVLRVLGPQTHSLRICRQCRQQVDAEFLFCPHCGMWKSDFCRQCRRPLEEGWHACPGCGTPVEMDLNQLPAGRG